jgi:threonine dehydrogenase-like Zn-dependent dehydrogenase
VIDATGVAAAITAGLARVARGGTFVQLGVAAPDARVQVAPYWLLANEISLMGSMTTLGSFPRALRLLETEPRFAELVRPPRPLTEYALAVADLRQGLPGKVTVCPQSPAP